MRTVIIEDGIVVNAAKVETEEFATAQGWVLSDTAQRGDSYDVSTGEFTAPPVPDMTLDEAEVLVIAWVDALTTTITSRYPNAVRQRWLIEEAAARAVKAGTADQDQTDMITDEGTAKGRTPLAHADKVIENADKFRSIANNINKLFLGTKKALNDAPSASYYPAILDAAKAQAAPLAAAYGLGGPS